MNSDDLGKTKSQLIEELELARAKIRTLEQEFPPADRPLIEKGLLLETLFEQAPNAILVLDTKGRYVMINSAASRIAGREGKDWINRRAGDYLHPDDFSLMAGCFLEGVAGRESEAEIRVQRLDGSYATLMVKITPLTWRGRPHLLAMAVDISDLKEVQRELERTLSESRRQEKETEALLKGAKAILEEDTFAKAARRIFDACLELTGAAAGYVALFNDETGDNDVLFLEAGGRICTVDPNAPMPLRGLRAEAYRLSRTVCENDFANSPWKGLVPDGHVILDNVMLSPFTIEGRTIGIMALANKPGGFTGREVTLAQSFGELAAIALRSSLTRAALVKSEERIRQILNAIPAGLFTYQLEEDGRLVLIDANPAGLALTGIEWEQWKGRDSREIWIGPGSDEIHEKCFQAIQTGEPQRIEGFDYRCSRGGGTYNMVLFSIPGRKLGVGFENVTDRLRLEEELQRSRKLEAVGVLAGGIAHDFNNILMGVLGNISMAQYELNNPDLVRDLLEQAEKACGRARELTSQILTFSRGGAPVRKNVDITELIRESAGFALRGSNVKCEFDFAPGLWAAEVDENQVRQVLSNLIINADQAMPDGGRLRIEARNQELLEESSPLRPGPYVWISVHDQGVGIGEETLPRIFDPYFTTKQKGPGLGLATAYSIVNRHGGKITAESTIGAGSTFHVLLPAAARAEARGEPAPASLLAGQGRALVMDDEEMVRKVAVAMLDRLGFEADGAADGKEAIDKYCQALAAGEPYRLVIMDLTVPGSMGGVEAIKGLRELDPAVKAIVASGYSHDPVMANHRAYGFDGVAAKPFRLEELSQTLNQVLGPGPAGRPA